MRLSIIIPIYNAEEYLEKSLKSVQSCNRDDIECIMVNDGSKDGSEVVCRKYAESDSRFLYVYKENGGVSSARNVGLMKARGEWVMFLDADDYLTEHAWEQIEKLYQQDMADYVAFSYLTLYEDGRTVEQPYSIKEEVSTSMEIAKKLVYASSEMNTCWGKLFRRSMICEHHITFLEDLPIGEDYLFVAEYFGYCKSSLIINQPLLYYLQRPDSAMRKYNMTQRLGFMEQLYHYNLGEIRRLADQQLENDFYQYYFRVVTNLFYVYAKGNSKKILKQIYREALQNQVVQEILIRVESKRLSPIFKKLECFFMRKKWFELLALYFGCKARV